MTRLFIPAIALLTACTTQAETHLTFYPGNMALVQETRTVTLTDNGPLRIDNVPSSLRPETLHLTIDGKQALGHRLLSRTPTRQRLLNLHLGRFVELVRIDPNSGRETRLDGTLIGVDGHAAIIETTHGIQVIHNNSDWSLIFPKGEHGFVHRPVLEALIPKTNASKAKLAMRYLANGLHWSVDYVAELKPDNSAMSLTAWTSLRNTTNQNFQQAHIALLAGQINRVAKAQPRMERAMMMADSGALSAPAQSSVAPQAGYHRYVLNDPVDLVAGESRQSALFQAQTVPTRMRYEFNSFDTGSYWRSMPSPNWRSADMKLIAQNKGPGLGRALPAGTVRVYQDAADGNSLLLGEASMNNTTKGETIALAIGKAFDVKGKRIQTNFKRTGRRESQSDWTIKLRNGSNHPISVRVQERMPELWEMLDSSHTYKKVDAQTLRWNIDIPANGETALNYRIHVRQRS